MEVTLSAEYVAATKRLTAALKAELEVAEVFGADRSDANWQRCLDAHNATAAAKAVCDSLEPEFLKGA